LIRFDKPPKPERFHAEAEVPGACWLADHPDAKRPHDYWTAFKGELADGFRNLCAYSAMYEPVGTVDHFVSWDEDRSLAYEWSNYRYAAAWINSSKQNIQAHQILDPFEIGEGWFEIILPSLQLQVSGSIPDSLKERAKFVLKRLHLRDDERVIRQRREWYRMYQDGELTLDGLRAKAPLIAAAIDKADR
jgi:hypothetical protein